MTMTTTVEAQVRRSLTEEFDTGFTELVRAYQPQIYSGALRMTRRPEDAKDVAQDTFVRAYRALRSYDDDRILSLQIRPWLWTIALNLCRNRARSKVTEVLLLDHDIIAHADLSELDDAMWNRRLTTLNSHQRTAVVMRHVLDLPIAEISQATGRPEGTVKADLSRGLDRLRLTIEAEVLNAT
jgi:RNA polymerase sigma-70 factor (ECF subfamily)